MPPVPGTGKRCSLSMELKNKILKEVDTNQRSRTEIAKAYNIPKSTLSTIIKNREKILKADHAGIAPGRSRTTQAKYPKLEMALLEWFKSIRLKNIPIDGNVFKVKADDFALRMNIADFKASDGWLQRFKMRHGLAFKKLCGESSSVDLKVTSNWQDGKLQRLLKDYAPDDVFNADETALFFKVLPDRALVFKGETCSGGKQAKHRITLMLAANMSGTEKLPLLAIGKSKNPRCFKGIRTLPTKYENNAKAWMTGKIYKDWLCELDKRMMQKNRRILLIVDNCTAHEQVGELQAIKVEFLPPNTTAVLQPMDQGIIQAFKKHYRKRLLNRMVLCLDHGKEFSIDLLGALHLAAASWKQLSQQTIANCFRHAGFARAETPLSQTSDDVTQPDSQADSDLEVNESASDFLGKLRNHFASLPDTFQEYVNIDNQVQCSEELTEEAIIQKAICNASLPDDSSSEEETEDEPAAVQRPSMKQATDAIATLRNFFEKEAKSESYLTALMDMENGVLKCSGAFRQSTITGFFTRDTDNP